MAFFLQRAQKNRHVPKPLNSALGLNMKYLSIILILYCSVLIGGENKLLHPYYPVVSGEYKVTEQWSLSLTKPHNKRIEDGSLVIWRPGFTIWINVWNNDNKETINERLKRIKNYISKNSFELNESKDRGITKFSYKLNEINSERVAFGYYGFAINNISHVQIAMYFDDELDASVAKNIFLSINENIP